MDDQTEMLFFTVMFVALLVAAVLAGKWGIDGALMTFVTTSGAAILAYFLGKKRAAAALVIPLGYDVFGLNMTGEQLAAVVWVSVGVVLALYLLWRRLRR